jgi:hypothetical protein
LIAAADRRSLDITGGLVGGGQFSEVSIWINRW